LPKDSLGIRQDDEWVLVGQRLDLKTEAGQPEGAGAVKVAAVMQRIQKDPHLRDIVFAFWDIRRADAGRRKSGR
jgi:hypothetical protein